MLLFQSEEAIVSGQSLQAVCVILISLLKPGEYLENRLQHLTALGCQHFQAQRLAPLKPWR